MSNQIHIHLDKTDFSGGDTVAGELELQIDTAIPVRGVRVLLHGFEQSYWSPASARIRTSSTGRRRAYTETLDLFKQELTVFGDPPLEAAALIADSFKGLLISEHYHTLEPGNYRYPFSFTLPQQIPGDYESGMGRSKIEYLLQGYLDIPLNIDAEQSIVLTIYEKHDQSTIRSEPISDYKTFDFESATAYNARFSLDGNVYFPGDTINCRLWLKNRSDQNVQAVAITLHKKEALRAQGSSTSNIEKVHRELYENSSIAPGQTRELELAFTVPNNLYPTIVSSALVQVEYHLVAEFVIPWAIDHDIEVPIVLLEEAGRAGGITMKEKT